MNNVVGKMLIVLQLVFSLLFMCFAGAAYTFQLSWRTKAQGFESRLQVAERNLTEEQEQNKQKLETLAAESTGFKNRAEAAEGSIIQLQTDLQTARGNQAQAEQQRDKHMADLQVAQAEANARIAETLELRAETKKLRDTVGTQIADIRSKEDQNLGLTGQVAEAKEREVSALKEIGRLQDLLRFNKIDPRQPITGAVPAEIVKVDGKVMGSKKNASRSAELVHVSIGSDDQIVKDMKMDVYRGNQWIAEIRITDVYPDQAVGLVVERTRNGIIERGDDVTTKL